MTFHSFVNHFFKKTTVFFTLICLVLVSAHPNRLNGEDCQCLYMQPEECPENFPCQIVREPDVFRSRSAKVALGATLIALAGGIAYFALGDCGKYHKHKHHGEGGSFSGLTDFSYGGGDNGWGSNDNQIYGNVFSGAINGGSEVHPRSDPQIFERSAPGNLPARARRSIRMKNMGESDQISGTFMTHPTFSPSAKGSVSAFVQMPDGSIQSLGTLSFSSGSGSSLPYGPFTQKGSYVFGIKVDEGVLLSSQIKVGAVEVSVNGSTVEKRDFILPAHASRGYEPTPCEYRL